MSIHHHSLMVVSRNKQDLFDFCSKEGFKQFAFLYDEGVWTVSAPLTAVHRIEYAWLYEKQKESKTE